MPKKITRVQYTLNPCKKPLNINEIKSIIRAAEDVVYKDGRSLLAKILKSSKDKKILELKLDKNPSYGIISSQSKKTIALFPEKK